jgi:hypothetical protein
MQELAQFLAELRRRRVVRVALVYAVVGWIIIQVTETLVPVLLLPDWITRAVVLVILLSFPLVLVLAWIFDVTPEGVKRTASLNNEEERPIAPVGKPRLALGRGGWFLLGGLVSVTLGYVVWDRQGADVETAGLDSGVVAVLPFRVSGNAGFEYLAEGMVDLLAATLTGEGGLRAADPRAVLAAWRRVGDAPDADAAGAVARSLGAGRVLVGSVVGTNAHMTLLATLQDAVTGRTQAEARAEGPADSLSAMVERLASQLLARAAGEGEAGSASLSGVPLPALRAYLDGRAASRAGRYAEAIQHLERALAVDSTFALAALNLYDAAAWIGGDVVRPSNLAWTARDRLSPRDRAHLDAVIGPRYPAPPNGAELAEAAERLVQLAAERPEAWYLLGDLYFHFGPMMEIGDWRGRAQTAFYRALELDSTFAAPLQHLVEMAAQEDTAELRRLVRIATAGDDVGDAAGYFRWHAARAAADSAALAAARQKLPDMHPGVLHWTVMYVVHEAVSPEEATAAAATIAAKARSRAERQFAAYAQAHVAYALGRPAEAARFEDAGLPAPYVQWRRVLHALYGNGDAALAAIAARQLEVVAAQSQTTSATARLQAQLSRCVLGLMRAAQGDLAGAEAMQRGLHGSEPTMDVLMELFGQPVAANASIALCADMLGVAIAVARGPAGASAAVERLDERTRTAPWALEEISQAAPLVLAQAREALGDRAAALRDVRRRHYYLGHTAYLPNFLREEGRLASLAGDRAGAIRAYTQYLTLYERAEPALRSEIDEVRRALARLTTEAR